MSILGHYNNFFFAAHLLDIAMGFKTLRTILSSVTHNGKQVRRWRMQHFFPTAEVTAESVVFAGLKPFDCWINNSVLLQLPHSCLTDGTFGNSGVELIILFCRRYR